MSLPEAKKCRLLGASLRIELTKDEVIDCVKSCWTDPSYDSSKLEGYGVKIMRDPFPVCVIENFITNSALLKAVVEEVKKVKFNEKSNDLYHFKQSDDVQNLKSCSFIPQLYDLIRNEGLGWVNKTLGSNQLKQDISATFSSYSYQDRLLCHDDKCEDRHIAFILYLVENWQNEDGGVLELFNTDSGGYPQDVVRSIFPEFNTIVLFEVTHESFHQVSEVTSKSKQRLSLNGWFHSSNKKLNTNGCEILHCTQNFGNNKVFNLEDYFSPIYFNHFNKLDIRDKFLEDSEIQLEDFFLPNMWQMYENDFKSNDIKWSFIGPANIRKYEVAESSSLPVSVQTLKEMFESKCWFKYLKSLTGLDFAPADDSDLEIWESGSVPYCSCEVQRWTHSCYTLIHDKDPEFHTKGLDVVLRIPFQKVTNVNFEENASTPEAGHIIYIDAESKEEECLLHLGYKMNSLALIFRDKKTLRFTKYLTSTAEPFYQIFCTYRPWRPPVDEPNLRHCLVRSDSENTTTTESSYEDEYLTE